MALAGVYDRSGGQEAGELGMAGAFGGVGTGIGRGVAAVAPTIKGAISNALPKAAAGFLGADPEAVATATALRDKGVLVPPSAMFKESPHIANIAEVFDPAFRTQKPLLQSATEHYEKTGKEILGDLGVKDAGSLSNPEAAVSTEKAGEAVLGRTREELRRADENLRQALEQRRALAAAGKDEKTAEHASHMSALQSAETEARRAAQAVIDEGFETISRDSDAAMKAAKSGHNSGDLWWNVGEKLKLVRAGFVSRASKMYAEADELSGGLKPDIGGLPERAEQFLNQLPDGFEGKYPTIVKQLRDIAGVQKLDKNGNLTGEWEKPPVEPTWAQLHNLRSVMRANYNRLDLTPDIKQGTYKFFANRVDQIINDTEAAPELKAAAKRLREADTFYRDNMGPLNDRRIQAVMDGLESGLPADPKLLFDTLVKEGRSDLTKKVAELVGPNLWAGVKAADVREMLDQSKSLIPGEIDGRRFAQQVLDRQRNGMLDAVHGKEVSEQLLQQAQNVAMLDGKIDIGVRPTDKIADIIGKARAASEAVKQAAKQDPLGTLNKEMKAIERDHAREVTRLKAQRRNDPLAFLYNPSTGASEAVEKILGSEDLVLATAGKFGPDLPEFKMLRQVWVQRLLTGTLEPSTKLAKVSEEVQRIMFPGVSLDQMKTLAKEMDFLMSSRGAKDTAKSMAAVSKVEHPWSSIPLGGAAGKLIPGFDAAGRYMLGKYFKTVTTLVNNPAFLRWVEKGLHGNEQAREVVREAVQKRMKQGGILGAAVAQSQFQTPNEELLMPGERKAPDGNIYRFNERTRKYERRVQ